MNTKKINTGKLVGVKGMLPYTPYPDEILLVDGHHTIKVERWRIDYYKDMISDMLNVPSGYAESYFELVVQMMQAPGFWEYFSEDERHDIESEIIDAFDFSQYVDVEDIQPSLFILNEYDAGSCQFRQFEIGSSGLLSTLKDVLDYMDEKDYEAGINYAEETDSRDETIRQLQTLVEQLNATVNLCKQKMMELGMTEEDIESVLTGQKKQQKIFIMKRNKVFLSEYDILNDANALKTEIRMAPLDKAVYFLYLNHPEGINFSYLSDYREELLDIYRKLMDYRTSASMLKSVEDVTDPTNNSINEKCARIRKAFVAALGKFKAEPYCITGARGERKTIKLDRSLVVKAI